MTKPRYLVIKNYVRRKIESGTWAVGDKIPSENTLAKQFDVSRMTANRAFKELQDSGVLMRVAGAGSFVASPRTQNEFLAIRDIAEELKEKNHVHKMHVLARKTIKADHRLAELFEASIGDTLFFASICHTSDGLPILLERRWVFAEAFPEFEQADLAKHSTYHFLMNAAPLQRAEHKVRAINADEDICKALQLEQGAACLVLHRRTWSQGQVVSCADLIYVGGRYEFTGSFGR